MAATDISKRTLARIIKEGKEVDKEIGRAHV
jgi:hypothetical protein